MPGATALEIQPGRADRFVARGTFGLLVSDDGGQHWGWLCEQLVGTNSVVVDQPVGITVDGSVVLMPPAGGALISRDDGCSWSAAPAPFVGNRGIDLTVDPASPARVIALLSSAPMIDAEGYPTYVSQLVESLDNANSFAVLATLPGDIELETVEVAPSDGDRIYVSGTASRTPSLGVVLRTDDRGKNWTRTTLQLPKGRGSLLVSAVHPTNPDLLWARVPARGDLYGALPASLYVSQDGGATFSEIASTSSGMLGFALSPDGTQLGYGGPAGGLHIGPSLGGAFEQVHDLVVTCLRWTEDGLYACAAQPTDPFTIALSTDGGHNFAPLYTLSDTCPQACAASSDFAMTCDHMWPSVAPRLGAIACLPDDQTAGGAADAGPLSDASMVDKADASMLDRGAEKDASAAAPNAGEGGASGARKAGGRGCALGSVSSSPQSIPWVIVALVPAVVLARSSRRRR